MTGSSPPVRARLRRDTFLIPTGDGARILTNTGAESFTGATIHGWLERLSRYLTGESTVDELVSALPADRGAMVERIITVLRDRGLTRDGGPVGGGPGGGGYLHAVLPGAEPSHLGYPAAPAAGLPPP